MNETKDVPMIETEVAKLSKVRIPCAVMRTGFGGIEDTVRGFKPLTLYVPEGAKYEVRDATDEEKAAFAHLRAHHDPTGEVPDVQQVIHFACGWMYAKKNPTDKMPTPVIFHHGMNIYVHTADEMVIEPDRSTPLEWANLMLTDADTDVPIAAVEGEPGSMTEAFRAMTLMMALNLLMRRQRKAAGKASTKIGSDKDLYGDECVSSDEDPEKNGYALLDALRFMGEPRAAMITRNGDTYNMRTFNKGGLFLVVPPGTQVKRQRLTEQEQEHVMAPFADTKCDLKPVEAITIPLAAIMDRQEGDDAVGDWQIALGKDAVVLCEAGVEVQNVTAWAPKLPFDVNGVTDYLDTSPSNPGLEAQKKALENVQHSFTTGE